MKRLAIITSLLLSTVSALAGISALSPANGEIAKRVPYAQRTVMALPTLEERIALFRKDRQNGKKLRHDSGWGKARHLTLSWAASEDIYGLWDVEIAKSPDFSDAEHFFYSDRKTNAATGRAEDESASAPTYEFTLTRPNLELGTLYYWRVTGNVSCGHFGHLRNCGCPSKRPEVTSEVASFTTADLPPRWIEIEGRVRNFRDLGGWKTADGREVRQGMAFRGQGLNDNSPDGAVKGRNRLTVEDVEYLTGRLGIKTDLDLRGPGEIVGMNGVSPLGKAIRYINHPSQAYRDLFTEHGRKMMAKNFRVFCDERNYPIYFHCIGGADRTGSLAYMLNGVLGVSRHDLEVDWESTFYPNIPDENPNRDHWCRESHLSDGIAKYGVEGDSWNRRIELFLLDCGITPEEIAAFRLIMLK